MSEIRKTSSREKELDEAVKQRPYGDIALALRARRRELGYSVVHIASVTGRSIRSIYEDESGIRKPNLAILAPILGISEGDFKALLPESPPHRDKQKPFLVAKVVITHETLANEVEDILRVEGTNLENLIVEGLTLVVAARHNDPAFSELARTKADDMVGQASALALRWQTPAQT